MSDPQWTLVGGRPVGIANWTAFENAIQAQVAAAAGLTPSNVVWSFQSRDRPSRDFIRLEIDRIESQNSVTPEESTTDNPTPTTGAEILRSSEEQIDFTVNVHFFSGVSAGVGAARSRLSTILRYLGTERVTDALAESLLALVDCGPVSALPVVLDVEFESRAVAALSFRAVDGFTEAGGYIATVPYTTTFLHADGTPVLGG